MRSEFTPLNADNLIPAQQRRPCRFDRAVRFGTTSELRSDQCQDGHLIPSADVAFVDRLDKVANESA